MLKKDDCLVKCFNNRAQCYIKLESFKKAIEDANKVILANADDTKALFRRSQALKELNRFDESLRDAKRLIQIEPKNNQFIQYIQSLTRLIQDKTNEQRSTKSQVKSMLDYTTNSDREKKLASLNNLIVLSREDAGCNEIIFSDGLKHLCDLYKNEKDEEVILSIARIFASLVKNSFKRAKIVYNEVPPELIASLISHKKESIATAAGLIVQNMIYSLTDLEHKRKTVKKQVSAPFEFTAEAREYIDEIFRSIVMLIMDPNCSGYGRDNCIDMCLKFVDTANGCAWTPRFIVFGIPKLLRVASTVPELNLPNSLQLTENTKMHVSCCLSAVYDDIYSDSERDKFQDVVNSFIKDLIANESDHNAQLRAVACLGCVLQGPFEVGSAVIVRNNLINLMLDLADSDDVVREKVAVEAVVYSASKKDKATGILQEGIDILKKLYNSKNNAIKVRALVGLCKLASCKGSDVSVKLLADGSVGKLEKACRKILCTAEDYDSKKWACDGLAYLTLDADIKEILTEDKNSLHILYDLTKKDDKNTLFSVASIFSNVSNAIPPKKPTEEMIKLANYAKHHVPEMHEKEKEVYYRARRQRLMETGVSNALVMIAKHNSPNCRELIAGVFLALCEEPENRGKIVAAGGGKALIPLALEGSEVGKAKAAQALAKMTISINPELAFPGQRVLEVVRPLIKLLHPDKTPLENYEALMALTNLASVNQSVRKRIVKEQGISNIEQYMFEEDNDLRVAGTECICNLSQDEDCIYVYEKPDNDRIKLLVLYCGEDDVRLNIAASGALAQFTEKSEKICNKLFDVASFPSIFKQCACAADIELQFRIFFILRNVAMTSKELCAKLVSTEVCEVIIALSRLEVEKEREKVKQLATDTVTKFLEYDLIKPTVAGILGTNDDEDD